MDPNTLWESLDPRKWDKQRKSKTCYPTWLGNPRTKRRRSSSWEKKRSKCGMFQEAIPRALAKATCVSSFSWHEPRDGVNSGELTRTTEFGHLEARRLDQMTRKQV